MRWILVFWLCLAGTGAAYAQPAAGEYAAAESRYNGHPVDERLRMQVLLTAAGYWNAVPNVSFSRRLFTAIGQFQADNGWGATGILEDAQHAKLFETAIPLLRGWDFRKIDHPRTKGSLWVPMGLGLQASRTREGIDWQDPENRVRVEYSHFATVPLAAAYEVKLRSAATGNETVHFKILKPDFFVVSSSTPSGIDEYTRYQKAGSGVVGFSLYWVASQTGLHMERVATLMSGSLWASSTGAAFPEPPTADESPAPATAAAAPPAREAKAKPATSGTGFFVTTTGTVLTNAHVVSSCASIGVKAETGPVMPGRVLARDATNDLALIQTDAAATGAAPLRATLRLGESVAAFGFPLSEVLASSGNFTLGNVTALSGIGDDSRYTQISAPVQPGNSGGPLLDASGNVVGIVSAKLNALQVMVATNGDIPQNVNFAIKGAVARTFLESNQVDVADTLRAQKMDPADLADYARSISVFVRCE